MALAIPVVVLVVFNVGLVAELAIWQRRRCPKCRKRYAFPSWDHYEWYNTYWSRTESDEDPPEEIWELIRCPHCGHLRKVRKVPARLSL